MASDLSSNSSAARNGDTPRNGDAALVLAESKTFVAFDQWMDDQLALLVARWIDTAAPNARRLEFAARQFGR